ncbi:hypothetical protein DID96_25845 [Burkholderia sp. Bp8963]|nr:hypothetical protein DID96_25845 [Burkholderia sp. Bp8963]
MAAVGTCPGTLPRYVSIADDAVFRELSPALGLAATNRFGGCAPARRKSRQIGANWRKSVLANGAAGRRSAFAADTG